MSYNICIVKPKNYPHSDAFWEMAELLAFSLRDLGQDVVISINEVFSDRQNILFGGHLLTKYDFPPSTIIFNTEQLSLGVGHWVERIISLGKTHLIWDYSENNIEFLRGKDCKRIKKYQIGYHEKLFRIPQRDLKDIDVLFYGSINDRRKKLLNELKESGLRVKALFGVYGAQRDEYISRAKIVLNCHHYDAKIFEIVRVHYLINNAVTVVSEVDSETNIDSFWRNIIFGVPFDEIVQECVKLSNNDAYRKKISERAFSKLKNQLQLNFTAELIGVDTHKK